MCLVPHCVFIILTAYSIHSLVYDTVHIQFTMNRIKTKGSQNGKDNKSQNVKITSTTHATLNNKVSHDVITLQH